MTKWVAQVERTEELPYYMAQAFRVAKEGRPGPVALALPEDMLAERSEVADLPVQPLAGRAPEDGQMAERRAILAKAQRPIRGPWRLRGSGGEDRGFSSGLRQRRRLGQACRHRSRDGRGGDHDPRHADADPRGRVQAAGREVIARSCNRNPR